MKIKYRRSAFGILWTLLNPMAMTLVFYAVFKGVLKVSTPHYLAFVMSGILPWTFFSQSLMENLESMISNSSLITKVAVPLQVFPFVGTLTNFITLLLAIPVIIAAVFLSQAPVTSSIFLVFFYFSVLFLMTYGFSIMLSTFFVYLRDLRHVMNIVLQIWFYTTPVLYDHAMIPAKYHGILYLNPVGFIFVGLHRIFAYGTWPSTLEVSVLCGWTALILLLAVGVVKYGLKGIVEKI